MQRTTKLIACIVSLCFLLPSLAVAGPDTNYRLQLKDGKYIQGKNAYKKDNIIVIQSGDGSLQEHFIGNLLKIQRQDGNQWRKGLKIGALSGMGFSLGYLVAALAETANSSNKQINTAAIIPFFTVNIAMGALIGSGIGSMSKKWETTSVPSKLSIDYQPKNNTLCVTYNF